EVVAALQLPGDAHVDRAVQAALDAQHVIGRGVDPDAAARGDRALPVEAVVMPPLVLDQLGLAGTAHGREVDDQRAAIAFAALAHRHEPVGLAARRQQERERLRRERGGIGAAAAVLAIAVARGAAVDAADVADDLRAGQQIAVRRFGLDAQLGLDGPGQALWGPVQLNRLDGGLLEADDALGAAVVVGDPPADAGHHQIDFARRLRGGRHPASAHARRYDEHEARATASAPGHPPAA